MIFTIIYNKEVIEKDIPKLGKLEKEAIKKAIEKKLTFHPEIFGKPLENSLKGYRRIRCGKHRVIFRIEKSIVKIMAIEHRSIVYQLFIQRLSQN